MVVHYAQLTGPFQALYHKAVYRRQWIRITELGQQVNPGGGQPDQAISTRPGPRSGSGGTLLGQPSWDRPKGARRPGEQVRFLCICIKHHETITILINRRPKAVCRRCNVQLFIMTLSVPRWGGEDDSKTIPELAVHPSWVSVTNNIFDKVSLEGTSPSVTVQRG